MTRRSRRWRVPAALAALAIAVAAGCDGGSDRGSERQAIVAAFREQQTAVRQGDAERACRKIFLSTDLPEPLGDQLGLPTTGPHRPDNWEKHYEQCVRAFDDERRRSPRVTRVLRVVAGGPTAEDEGITASARLRASIADPADNTSYRWTWRLVKFEGDWKVVFEVR